MPVTWQHSAIAFDFLFTQPVFFQIYPRSWKVRSQVVNFSDL